MRRRTRGARHFAATYEQEVLPAHLTREYLAIVNTAEGTVRLVQWNHICIVVDAEGNLYFKLAGAVVQDSEGRDRCGRQAGTLVCPCKCFRWGVR